MIDLQVYSTQFLRTYRGERPFVNAKFKQKLGNPKNRICRFCRRSNKETTFDHEAHLMPQFTGADRMKVFYECDECNDEMGRSYEQALGCSIGPYKTLYAIAGARGIPNHQVDETSLSAIRLNATDIKITFKTFVPIDKPFITDDGALIYDIPLAPFIPADAHRSMLHSAFNCLHDSATTQFEITRRWLRDEIESPYTSKNPAIIYQSFSSASEQKMDPQMGLFTRASNRFEVPEKSLVFLFYAVAMQVSLYSDKQFEEMRAGKCFREVPFQWLTQEKAIQYKPLIFTPLDCTAEIEVSTSIPFELDGMFQLGDSINF